MSTKKNDSDIQKTDSMQVTFERITLVSSDSDSVTGISHFYDTEGAKRVITLKGSAVRNFESGGVYTITGRRGRGQRAVFEVAQAQRMTGAESGGKLALQISKVFSGCGDKTAAEIVAWYAEQKSGTDLLLELVSHRPWHIATAPPALRHGVRYIDPAQEMPQARLTRRIAGLYSFATPIEGIEAIVDELARDGTPDGWVDASYLDFVRNPFRWSISGELSYHDAERAARQCHDSSLHTEAAAFLKFWIGCRYRRGIVAVRKEEVAEAIGKRHGHETAERDCVPGGLVYANGWGSTKQVRETVEAITKALLQHRSCQPTVKTSWEATGLLGKALQVGAGVVAIDGDGSLRDQCASEYTGDSLELFHATDPALDDAVKAAAAMPEVVVVSGCESLSAESAILILQKFKTSRIIFCGDVCAKYGYGRSLAFEVIFTQCEKIVAGRSERLQALIDERHAEAGVTLLPAESESARELVSAYIRIATAADAKMTGMYAAVRPSEKPARMIVAQANRLILDMFKQDEEERQRFYVGGLVYYEHAQWRRAGTGLQEVTDGDPGRVGKVAEVNDSGVLVEYGNPGMVFLFTKRICRFLKPAYVMPLERRERKAQETSGVWLDRYTGEESDMNDIYLLIAGGARNVILVGDEEYIYRWLNRKPVSNEGYIKEVAAGTRLI